MTGKTFIFESTNEADTIRFARNCASTLQKSGMPVAGQIICLHGTLGMGKSVFARALIRTLCLDEMLDVPSPTFTLVQMYDAADGTPIYHFDLYRLDDPEEVYELGWEDALTEGLCVIEWPERIGRLLPKKIIHISFEAAGEDPSKRRIKIEGLERNDP